MIFGAFAGLGAWAGIGIWRSRDLWLAKPEKFDGRGLFKQVAPLMLGFGACQFLFTADTMYAKAFFSGDEMASYVAAGTLSRALLWLVLPLAAVMFPKIVHASAKSEKSNLLGIVLLGTAVLAVCGAAGLCLVGPFVVKLIYTPDLCRDDGETAAVVCGRDDSAGAGERAGERFDGAREIQGRACRWCCWPSLTASRCRSCSRNFTRMEVALQTLGAFNLMLFGICAWFA